MQSKTARTESRYMKEILTRSAGIKGTGYEQVAPTVYALVAFHRCEGIPLPSSILPMYHSAVLLAQKLGLPGDDIQTAKVAGLLLRYR